VTASPAAVLAFAAAATGVLAVWEAAGAIEGAAVGRLAARLAAPLRAAPHTDDAAAAAERRRLTLVVTAACVAAGWILAGVVAGALCGAAGPVALGRTLAWRRERRRAALREGAAGGARAIADALSAGRSVRGAIGEAARGGAANAATREELVAAARALELGDGTEAVLERLALRADAPAWDTIVAAILLQRDAGGDLAGLLRAIAADVEAARRVEADARAATAQARFTANTVAVLPLGAAILAELGSPGTVAGLLAEPLPAMMAAAAAVLEVLALLAVRRLARMGGT
jgi:tight adherence protein B